MLEYYNACQDTPDQPPVTVPQFSPQSVKRCEVPAQPSLWAPALGVTVLIRGGVNRAAVNVSSCEIYRATAQAAAGSPPLNWLL